MKHLFTLFLVVFISCLTINISLAANSLPEGCAASVATISTTATIPSKREGIIRALVVFIKFSGDTFENEFTCGWPHDKVGLPDWANSIIDPQVSTIYTQGTLSDYFYQMSMGKLNLIGDVHPQLMVPSLSNYGDYGAGGYGKANKEILDQLSQSSSGIDWGQYDNDGLDGLPNSGDDDGNVDEIFMLYRLFGNNFISGPAGGEATLGFSSLAPITTSTPRTGGGYITITRTSGTTQYGLNRNYAQDIMCHEFGHHLFLPNITHFNRLGLFGLMDTDSGKAGMSAFERIYLGWITPIPVTSSKIQVTITDAITTGLVYKIPVDKNNPDVEYFLVENRQRISYYEQIYNDCVKEYLPAPGILITHIKGTSFYSPGGWEVDVETADGLYDIYNSNPDAISGKDELDCNAGTGGNCNYDPKPDPSDFGGAISEADKDGDIYDTFYSGNNLFFTPHTNPNSNKYQYHDYAAPQDKYTGVAAKIRKVNVNGDIVADLYTSYEPDPPTNASGEALSNNNGQFIGVNIKWNRVYETGVQGYYISRSSYNFQQDRWCEDWGFISSFISSSTTYYVDRNAQKGKYYRYRVEAIYSFGKTAYSNEFYVNTGFTAQSNPNNPNKPDKPELLIVPGPDECPY